MERERGKGGGEEGGRDLDLYLQGSSFDDGVLRSPFTSGTVTDSRSRFCFLVHSRKSFCVKIKSMIGSCIELQLIREVIGKKMLRAQLRRRRCFREVCSSHPHEVDPLLTDTFSLLCRWKCVWTTAFGFGVLLQFAATQRSGILKELFGPGKHTSCAAQA